MPSESTGSIVRKTWAFERSGRGERVSCQRRRERGAATRTNDCWTMDSVSDELFDGRRIRLLAIADHFTRESWRSRSASGSAARMSWQC